MRPPAPANTQHRQPQRSRRGGDSSPHIANPDDESRLALDRRRKDLIPDALMLVSDDLGHARVQHQQDHGRGLDRLVEMNTAIVRQNHLLRQPVQRQQRLDSGPDDMYPFQARRALRKRLPGKPGIDDHVVRRHQHLRVGQP